MFYLLYNNSVTASVVGRIICVSIYQAEWQNLVKCFLALTVLKVFHIIFYVYENTVHFRPVRWRV